MIIVSFVKWFLFEVFIEKINDFLEKCQKGACKLESRYVLFGMEGGGSMAYCSSKISKK